MNNREVTLANLETFREVWTGERILELLPRYGGRVLVTWPIGVGKSHNLDELVEVAVKAGLYDLLVVLLPTRNVLEERAWIRLSPPGVHVVNLRPRPRHECGKDINRQWEIFESRGMGLLGKVRLCHSCRLYSTCFWLNQYGRDLQGAQVIFATQTHLERDPTFTSQLMIWTGAKRVLVILDEANFIAKSVRRRIKRMHIQQLMQILERGEDEKAQ